MNVLYLIVCSLILFTNLTSSANLITELYCGNENCYDVLAVKRNESRHGISKAYRKLARIHHPDLASSPEEKKLFTLKFRQIVTAYETLRDVDVRKDYDEYLDDPSAYYRTYYRYYRRRLTPKVDVRIVIAVAVVVASVIHYYAQCSSYEQTITTLMNIPKIKKQALEIAKSQGLLATATNGGKRDKRATIDRSEERYRQYLILRSVVANEIGTDRLTMPSIWKTIGVQIVLFPITVLNYVYWLFKWQIDHRLLNKPLSDDEKLYLIRSNMGMSECNFRLQYGDDCHHLLEKGLWIRAHYNEWVNAQQEQLDRQRMMSGRYKRYERWSRKTANNQITFDPD